MPIPDFQDDGLLPPGRHTCTWDEMVQRLGFTPRRKDLIGGFRRLLDILPHREAVRYLIVNGSFVQAKPDPKDIDILLVVGSISQQTAGGQLLLWVEQHAVSLKQDFWCDVYVADDALFENWWAEFFGHTRNDTPKGVLVMEVPRE